MDLAIHREAVEPLDYAPFPGIGLTSESKEMRDLRAICNQNRSDLYRRRHNHSKQHCRAVMIEQARQLLPTPEMKGRECRKLTERFHSTDQASLALPDACRFSSQRLPISVPWQRLPQEHTGYPLMETGALEPPQGSRTSS
jgi:hypothetical protein